MGQQGPRGWSRPGAGVVAALLGVVLAAGVAGAADPAPREVTIRVDDAGPLFTPDTVEIATGDTVTWTFDGTAFFHNAAPFITTLVNAGSVSRRFTDPGTFHFFCQVHEQMGGVITVTGDPVPPQDPTTQPPATDPAPGTTAVADEPPPAGSDGQVARTATAGEPPAPSPAAGSGPVTTTTLPAPGTGSAVDTVAPAISRLRLERMRQGARVAFALSESASLTLVLRRPPSRRALRTVRVHARRGAGSVTMRLPRPMGGSYTVEARGRDAAGNRSAVRRATLRLRR